MRELHVRVGVLTTSAERHDVIDVERPLNQQSTDPAEAAVALNHNVRIHVLDELIELLRKSRGLNRTHPGSFGVGILFSPAPPVGANPR